MTHLVSKLPVFALRFELEVDKCRNFTEIGQYAI